MDYNREKLLTGICLINDDQRSPDWNEIIILCLFKSEIIIDFSRQSPWTSWWENSYCFRSIFVFVSPLEMRSKKVSSNLSSVLCVSSCSVYFLLSFLFVLNCFVRPTQGASCQVYTLVSMSLGKLRDFYFCAQTLLFRFHMWTVLNSC